MKNSDVKIGGTYLAKVSGALVEVRVDRVHREATSGGIHYGEKRATYACTNLTTGRRVIKGAAALRAMPVKLTVGLLTGMAAIHVGPSAVVRAIPDATHEASCTALYRVDAPVVTLPAMRMLWEHARPLDKLARLSLCKLDGPTAGLCSVVVRVYL